MPQKARRRPRPAPRNERRKVSVRIWRTMRARLEPRARRVENSRSREAAFAKRKSGEVGAGYEEDEDDDAHEDVQGLLIENAYGVETPASPGRSSDEGLLDFLTRLSSERVGFVIGEVLLGLGSDPRPGPVSDLCRVCVFP